jgi:cytochrome c oxidase subunit 2
VLDGVFGRQVRLQNGETVAADEAYIRESIVTPSAKLVAGFQPVMPTYQGLVSEEGLMQLIAYIRGLKAPAASDAGGAPAEPKAPPARTRPGKDR